MTTWLVVRFAAVAVVGYLIGGIPWSLIIGKRFYGIDLREHGSGNLGATNVFRTLGAKAAIVTLLLDISKGSAAVLLARLLVPASSGVAYEWAQVLGMMAAVVGHGFSPYIRLRGGKGVATSAGGLLVITPLATVLEILLFVAVVASSRMVSLGSIVVAIAYPVLVLYFHRGSTAIVVMSFAAAALVLWLHRSNMRRIIRREESRVSFSRRGQAVKDRQEG